MAFSRSSGSNGRHPLKLKYDSSTSLQAPTDIPQFPVLPYFNQSPFSDPTSNNAVLLAQSAVNPSMAAQVSTREAMEAQLRRMNGLQFWVTHDPIQHIAKVQQERQKAGKMDSAGMPELGAWVIRKQMRRGDNVETLGACFVMGDCIYQAPAARDVLGSRLVSGEASFMADIQAIAESFRKSFPHPPRYPTSSPPSPHFQRGRPTSVTPGFPQHPAPTKPHPPPVPRRTAAAVPPASPYPTPSPSPPRA